MFEKSYNYSDIKGMELEVIFKKQLFDTTFTGICMFNNKLLNLSIFDNMNHCLAIHVDEIPKVLSTSFLITINEKEQNNGHLIYLPYRSIRSLSVIREDEESKLMLLWIYKKKKYLPLDIVKYIFQYIKGYKVKIPVINLIDNYI